MKYKTIKKFNINADKLIHFIDGLKSKKLKLISISTFIKADRVIVLKYYIEKQNQLLIIDAPVKKDQIASLFTYFSNADFIEREISQSFGVKFIGNPNLNI
ncbi:MAG: NADH-quinone oxidoreductase subunit C [Armatimonadota bacterium]